MKKTPVLTKEGLCPGCKIWLRYSHRALSGGLPTHNQGGGENTLKCIHSGFSPRGYRYVIKSDDKAREVANFIRNDDGRCLVDSRGHHSMACGDGDVCDAERRLLAQALATYYLENARKQDEPKEEAGATA